MVKAQVPNQRAVSSSSDCADIYLSVNIQNERCTLLLNDIFITIYFQMFLFLEKITLCTVNKDSWTSMLYVGDVETRWSPHLSVST